MYSLPMTALTAPNLGVQYATWRERMLPHDEAIARLASDHHLEPAYVQQLATAESWRRRYENVQATRVLTDDYFNIAWTTTELLLRVREAADVLAAAYEDAQVPGASDKDVAKWRSAQLTYNELTDRVAASEARIRARAYEMRATKAATARHQALTSDLLTEYGEGGPQYRILAELVADAKIRLEEAQASGRTLDTQEFSELVKLTVGGIAQIQKYTEATKVERINKEVQAAVITVLEIVEHRLVDHPRLWQTIAHDVDERLQAVGEGA